MKRERFRLDENDFCKAFEHAPIRGWVALIARANLRTWGAVEATPGLKAEHRRVFRSVLDTVLSLAGEVEALGRDQLLDARLTSLGNEVDADFGHESAQSSLGTNFWALQRIVDDLSAVVEHRSRWGEQPNGRLADDVMSGVNNALFASHYFGNDEHVGIECGRDRQVLAKLPRESSPGEAFIDPSENGPFGSLWVGEPPVWKLE